MKRSYIITIDRASIRRNSDAGRTMTLVPRRETSGVEVDGTRWQRLEVIPIYHGPEPSILFEYATIEVECEACGACFPHTELREEEDSNFGEGCSGTVCPRCGAWDCCEIEYEHLSLTELRELCRAGASRSTGTSSADPAL